MSSYTARPIPGGERWRINIVLARQAGTLIADRYGRKRAPSGHLRIGERRTERRRFAAYVLAVTGADFPAGRRWP